MALIPYEPFKDIENFFDDEDWFFPIRSKQKVPEMDVYETEDCVIAEVSAPGMDSDDLSVTIDNNVLRIRGNKEMEDEEKDEERGYYRREIKKGSFERAVRLPSNVDQEKIKASHKKGILKIEIPKKEKEERGGQEVEIEIE